jgi:hypothetical protein
MRPKCGVKGCKAGARISVETRARRAFPVVFCGRHRVELRRLMRAQSRDWAEHIRFYRPSSDFRMYLATLNGVHTY